MSAITIRFIEPDGTTRVVADAAPGMSVMELARANGVSGIDGDCGGACACATCHVHVAPGFMGRVGRPDEVGAEMLDLVAHFATENSRLCCQIRISEDLDGLELTVAHDN